MALVGPVTLRVMATKTLGAREKTAFVLAFSAWVNEKHGGNQTHAGKAIGITQSHVSALMGGDRGPGLNLLMKLRKPMSLTIDEILGLDPLPGRDIQALATSVAEVLLTRRALEEQPPVRDPDIAPAAASRRQPRQ